MHQLVSILKDIMPAIEELCNADCISDIRLRVGLPIIVKTIDNRRLVIDKVLDEDDLQAVVAQVTGNSIYAYEDEINSGYLYLDGGVRIGIAGACNVVGDKIRVRRYTSLVIRVPHQIVGVADNVGLFSGEYSNTLIVASPGCGKTTLLRDAIRKLSCNNEVLVIDERYEIGGGVPLKYDFGHGADFLAGVEKCRVTVNGIRSLSPSIVAMDELANSQDYSMVKDLSNSGVKVLATMHGDSIENVKSRLGDAYNCFPNIVVLHSIPTVGSIKSIVRKGC